MSELLLFVGLAAVNIVTRRLRRAMMRWVSAVVWVMPQAICGTSIRSVMKEKGWGSGSAGCISRRAQSIVRPSSRAGVPVLSRPIFRPRP